MLLCAGPVCFAPWCSAQSDSSLNRSKSFGPDACGPADPAYIQTANETGGIPMFLQRSEAGKAFHLVRESTRNNMATLFWGTGALEGRPKTIKIPVDSTVQRITFTFSTDMKGAQFTVVQPSGGTITANLGSAEVTELNCGRILTINSPEPGEWRADLSGIGRYWAEAQAQSEIHFIEAEFVKEGGRPGHEGLFRIPGQPVAGKPATLEVSLSADAAKTVEFYLVSEEGQILQQLKMRPVNEDRSFQEFVGNLRLPDVPFRIAVTGDDSSGRPYQRFFPSLFHAENVEISALKTLDEMAAGNTQQMIFKVRNIGNSRTFRVTVTDAHRFVSGVEPKELALGADESGTVRVNLTVPAGTPLGTGDDVVIVVASTTGTKTSNSSVVHLSISSSELP